MHTSPIHEASPQDQHWYTLELRDFLLAQLDQLSYRAPSPAEPTQLYKWVADIGARSVGTKYMFAGFSCMSQRRRISRSAGRLRWRCTWHSSSRSMLVWSSDCLMMLVGVWETRGKELRVVARWFGLANMLSWKRSPRTRPCVPSV